MEDELLISNEAKFGLDRHRNMHWFRYWLIVFGVHIVLKVVEVEFGKGSGWGPCL